MDDGITLSIVSVPKIGTPPLFIPIPSDTLSGYIRDESAKETESDIVARLAGRIDDQKRKLDEISELIISSINSGNKGGNGINGDTLLKAIALAQNPELASKLLAE